MPATAIRLRNSAAFLFAFFFVAAAFGQSKSFTDAAVPVAIVAHPTFSVVDVLNKDRSITQYATESISNAGYTCAAAPGLAAQGATPHGFVTDGNVFEIGPPATGSGLSIAPISSPNYTACRYGTVTPIPGSPTMLLLAGADNRHFRIFTVTGNGGSSPETITGFNSQPFYTSSGSIVSLGQATLDQGATYTSIVSDVDGTYYGDTAITELRTATTAGNLWIYNASTGKAYKILAPDGSALPAINSFIIHNPNDIEGGLLVLASQDGLTASNITNPPLDASPFAIIDLGQLHQLIDSAPNVVTITLPSIVRIPATAPYYAMLGAAWNPTNNLLYAVVGGADSNGNPIRQIFAYNPYTPTKPNEYYFGDVTSVPITPPYYPQIVLNGAANTMQFLTQSPTAAYSIPLNFLGTNTVSQLTGSNFTSDRGFTPTAMTVNPLTGDTWFTSSTGRVDALTLPTASRIQDSIDMTGPLVDSYVGTDTGLQLLSTFPQHFDQGLYNTNITVTATKAGGTPYTFASVAAQSTIGGGVYISGNFPTAGIYTLTANFPGDTVFPAVTSLPVVVAVAAQPFTTSIAATAKSTSATAAVATVTLNGSTYAPTGTINIIDATSGSVLTSYTLAGGVATLKIPFTQGTSTSIKAQYLGDPLNTPSTSSAAVIAGSGTAPANLAFSGPTTTTKNFTIRLYIALTSSATTIPTGNITLTATSTNSGTLPLNPATVLASDAFVAGGAQIHFAPPIGGTYTLTATYNGDSVYAPGSGTATLVVAGSADTLTLTPPVSANTQNPFNIGVLLASTDTSTATGNVTITSQLAGGPVVNQGVVAATDAFQGYPFGVGLTVPGVYTFSASYPGDKNFAAATATTSVTVAGVSQLNFSVPTLIFTANLGSSATPASSTVTNTGSASITFSSIAASGSGFTQTNNCPAILVPKASCQVTVTFKATIAGTTPGQVTFSSTGYAPTSLTLSGIGLGPVASLSPSNLYLNDQSIGTTTVIGPLVTLTNTGNQPLVISSIISSATADYEVKDVNCLFSSPLPAGNSCTAYINFHPSAAGVRTANITFNTSDRLTNQTIPATGSGLNPGACVDTDGDGLCDDWETNGVMVHLAAGDKYINLPAMGADPKHKDIFIHIDYMELNPTLSSGHTHKPMPKSISFLEKIYNSAYVKNPDGTTGIHLHIDGGPDTQMDPVTLALWSSLSAASSVSETEPLDPVNTAKSGAFDWTGFDSYAPTYKASGRSFLFHHMIWGHDLRKGDTTSGISRNDATSPTSFQTGASDLIVSLGSWPTPNGTYAQQTGTMMHELGHNLSLEHGGRDNFAYKPNQLSNMNYAFQMVGVPNGKQAFFDYSQFATPLLNESSLNEVAGIAADPKTVTPWDSTGLAINTYGTYWYCTGDNPVTTAPHSTTTINSNLDWNCNKSIDTQLVYQDLNNDGNFGAYVSVQEWPLLKLTGGSIGQNGVGGFSSATPPSQTVSDEIDLERSSLILGNYTVAAFGQQIVQAVPGSTVNLRFVVQNTGRNADTYSVTGVSALGWSAAKPTPASLTLAPGATAEVTMPFTVPLTAVNGTKETLTLNIASSAGSSAQEQFLSSIYADSSAPALAISRSSLNFGTQATGGTTNPVAVMLTNTGTSSLALGFAASSEFAQTNTCGTSLAPGAACSAALTFSPVAAGVRSGTLVVSSPGLSASASIALSGTAVVVNTNPHPVILFSVTPTSTSTGQTVSILATLVASAGTPTPTGVITFTDGTTIFGTQTANSNGIATLNLTNLPAGTYNLHASYPGDMNYNTSTSPIASFTISTAVSTSALVASSAISAAPGVSVTFTATIAGGSGTSFPTGTVKFLDGTTLLGAGTLNAAATTAFTISTLALGTHPISVSYAGDAVFAAATSPAIQQVIVSAPDYSVTANPASLTIAHGASGSVVFTVTPLNSYAGTVGFTCGTLPANMTCSFAPTSVVFAKTAQTVQTVTLTVNTSAAHAALTPFNPRPSTIVYAVTLWFPGSLLGLLALRRRSNLRRLILVALLGLAGLVTMSGCAGSAAITPTTASGTYSVPVTITDGTTAHSLSYSIVVQ